MNSCRTGYDSASYFGFLNFSSILNTPAVVGQLFMPACCAQL